MNIILVGCGKVGSAIATQLAEEKHDIVIVDTDAEKLEHISLVLDVMGIQGDGVSASVLEEAGAKECDLLIAVTQSDEKNLLSCLIARKLGAKNTIARVRNPVYSESISLIKEDMGLSMIINPEAAAAREISRTLRFSSALKVETFARSRAEVMKHRIMPESILCGLKLKDLKSEVKKDIFICAIERGDDVFIPYGETELLEGDIISFLAAPGEAHEFFKKIGAPTHKIKNIILVGGGHITFYLAELLLQEGIKVKIIEKNMKRCEELSELLPGAMVICGDGTDNELLHEEGIDEADAIATLTGLDEQNVLVSVYASQCSPDIKVFTVIRHFDFDNTLRNMNIGSVVYPKNITAEHIIKYVRVMQNSIGSNVETLHHIVGNRVEVLEFKIRERLEFLSVPIKDLRIPRGVLIASISRNGRTFIPKGTDTVEYGDTVIVVTASSGHCDIKDVIKYNEEENGML